jgi:hypothetical protein
VFRSMGSGSMKARRQCGHGRKVTLGFELVVLVESEVMFGSCIDWDRGVGFGWRGRGEMGGGINKQTRGL